MWLRLRPNIGAFAVLVSCTVVSRQTFLFVIYPCYNLITSLKDLHTIAALSYVTKAQVCQGLGVDFTVVK